MMGKVGTALSGTVDDLIIFVLKQFKKVLLKRTERIS